MAFLFRVCLAVGLVGCGTASHDGDTPFSGGGSSSIGGAGSVAGTDTVGGGGSTPGGGPSSHAGTFGTSGAGRSGSEGGAGSAGGTASGLGGMDGAAGGVTGSDAGSAGSAGNVVLTADQIGSPVRVAGGFRLAESPLWDPCGHRLLFVDVQGDGGRGAILTVGADGQVSTVMANTTNTNGMAYDVDGSLILAQMGGGGHVARRDTAGKVTVLEAPGPNLHTPDDVVVRSDGTIYFADGDFCPIGTLLGYGSNLPVYMMRPGSSALVNSGTVGGPNGIELSPDEKTLYVNAFGEGSVWTFQVAADGSLTKASKPLVTGLARPDSLCLDTAGNLYVAVTSGLQVLSPDGKKIKLIPITSLGSGCLTPGTTNCTFGGDDGKTLYITNWTTLYKVDDMPIPGLDWVVSARRAKCN